MLLSSATRKSVDGSGHGRVVAEKRIDVIGMSYRPMLGISRDAYDHPDVYSLGNNTTASSLTQAPLIYR